MRPDKIWLVQNLDNGAEHLFWAEHLAMKCAENMVGNRSYARFSYGYLYVSGDGTTSVMVRLLPLSLLPQNDRDNLPVWIEAT